MQVCNITVEDAYFLLGAVIRRALSDARSGTPDQAEDAVNFLDWVCPHWQEWPAPHQWRAATIAAQRLAALPRPRRPSSRPYRNDSN